MYWYSKKYYAERCERKEEEIKELQEKIEKFQEPVFEKEVVKSLQKELDQQITVNKVLEAENNVLKRCSDTLTEALKNTTTCGN